MLKNTKKVPRLVQHPEDAVVSRFADKYFLRTKDIVERFNDTVVTYAVFMRRPVTSATKLAVLWLEEMAKSRKTIVNIDVRHKEGAWIGAGEPIVYITGSLFHLVDLETQFLQKLG
ncbi:MAG: nicotinate phosphoribosyltransferase, partial [Rhodospirillaceae bacterium]|nr:nicotinate phosphoribosyltransferase [Rhodospirillaceae bacterium]